MLKIQDGNTQILYSSSLFKETSTMMNIKILKIHTHTDPNPLPSTPKTQKVLKTKKYFLLAKHGLTNVRLSIVLFYST